MPRCLSLARFSIVFVVHLIPACPTISFWVCPVIAMLCRIGGGRVVVGASSAPISVGVGVGCQGLFQIFSELDDLGVLFGVGGSQLYHAGD